MRVVGKVHNPGITEGSSSPATIIASQMAVCLTLAQLEFFMKLLPQLSVKIVSFSDKEL